MSISTASGDNCFAGCDAVAIPGPGLNYAMNGVMGYGAAPFNPNGWTLPGCPVINGGPSLGKPLSLDGYPTTMNATFTPTDTNGNPVGLVAAEQACQHITID